jgi:predicted enzyme related to lactoylglutathione lyase
MFSMSDELSRLSEGFDRRGLSRRQLLKGLGAVALAPAASAFAAQAGDQAATIEPAKAPFEPTGWKTVLLDHFSCKVADQEKEAAFYNALMNWGVRSSDAQESVLDIGDFGGIVIKGGYQPSVDALAAEKAQYDRRAAMAKQRGTEMGPFVPKSTVFDGFCWGIDQWDARKVEAALKARGLDPVADNQGHDFQSFHVKDPDGFDLQISNGNRRNRRTKPASGKLSAAAPFDHTDWKTVWIDHISYQCSDYKKTVAFYQALLGWEPTAYTRSYNQVRIGDVGDIIIRSGRGGAAGAPASAIDHIAVGIAPFNPEEVKAALDKRGLRSSIDTNGGGAIDTAPYKSYHTQTPNGFDLQISNVTIATRGL